MKLPDNMEIHIKGICFRGGVEITDPDHIAIVEKVLADAEKKRAADLKRAEKKDK